MLNELGKKAWNIAAPRKRVTLGSVDQIIDTMGKDDGSLNDRYISALDTGRAEARSGKLEARSVVEGKEGKSAARQKIF
ncbi:hypothetical protein IMZ48_05140 [Candidatus Bathyarchaeota archaeon]|nr:hypothetical protein [Candidatus Bathyarchaeota archaeon]